MSHIWETCSEEERDRNPWWTHVRRVFRRPDGREGVYDFARKGDAVVIFARERDGRFVMIREYRYLLDRVGMATAQGGIEPGESPEQAARRELREETGYEADTLAFVGTCASMPFLTNETMHVFCAEGLRKVGEHDDEVLDVFLMEPNEIDAAIRLGDLWDSHVIAAWHMVGLHAEPR